MSVCFHVHMEGLVAPLLRRSWPQGERSMHTHSHSSRLSLNWPDRASSATAGFFASAADVRGRSQRFCNFWASPQALQLLRFG